MVIWIYVEMFNDPIGRNTQIYLLGFISTSFSMTKYIAVEICNQIERNLT